MNSNTLSTKKINLSIIIINYNLADEIDNCLISLIQVMENVNTLNYEVIIVDNNSPDKKLLSIEKKYSQDFIHFYYLEKNLGFGKGCNFGFSKAIGEFICFLNPDTIIKEDIFTEIFKSFNQDKSIGIIGPKQQVREPFFDFSAGYSPKIIFELFNLIGVGVFVEGALIHFRSKKANRPIPVKWILGACIIIKADLFKSIGGFDKDYFMFFEEVDLCRRVLNKGYKVLYAPYMKIHHIGSVSGKKDYTLYTIRTYSSKYLYMSKHFAAIKKTIFNTLLYLQLFSQLIIWSILAPVDFQKSRQKLNAFLYLIRNQFRYKPNEI